MTELEPAGVRPPGTGPDASPQRALLAVLLACVLAFLLGSAGVAAERGLLPWRAVVASFPHQVRPVSPEQVRAAALEVLADHYYRAVDPALLAATPLSGLATALDDPYTAYLDPAQVAALERSDDGRYAGIGVHAVLVAGEVVLDRVAVGSPAAQAALAPGDVLVSADGVPLRGLPLETALGHVRGVAGSSVLLTVRRSSAGSSANTEARVRRAEVAATIVSHRLLHLSGRSVGYVQVLDFSRGVGELTAQAVRDLTARGADSVVLDLRQNGGGLVAEAVSLAAVFTPSGTPVLVETGRHVERTTYRTHRAPTDTGVRLAVLVDDQTASAAEIVTGALRDAGRAQVVGRHTYGKGVVQDLAPLTGGGALKYTMAEYVTPAGTHVDHRGLDPDVLVPVGVPGTDPERDADVLAAARSLVP